MPTGKNSFLSPDNDGSSYTGLNHLDLRLERRVSLSTAEFKVVASLCSVSASPGRYNSKFQLWNYEYGGSLSEENGNQENIGCIKFFHKLGGAVAEWKI